MSRFRFAPIFILVTAISGTTAGAQSHSYVSLSTAGPCPAGGSPTSVSESCSAQAWSLSGSASASAGRLAASSSVAMESGYGAHQHHGNISEAWSSARWSDRVTFSAASLVPASARLTLAVTASSSAWMSSHHITSVSSQANAELFVRPIWSPQGSGFASVENTAWWAGEPTADMSFGGPIQVTVSLADGDYGRVGFGFEYNIRSKNWMNTMPYSETGPARAASSVGAQLTEIAFFDASGARMTSGVEYTLDSGTIVAPVVTPEPATVGLLGLGLGAIGFVVRRRKR